VQWFKPLRMTRLSIPLSFRQLLLLAFLGIALLPSGALVRALLTIETLATQSREGSHDSVRLVQDIQLLGEQTVMMERRARQYLVLDEPGLRDSYRDAWAGAHALALRLNDRLPPALKPVTAQWLVLSEGNWALIANAASAKAVPEPRLFAGFQQLGALNARLAAEGRRTIEQQGRAVLEGLERQRATLGVLAFGSIALAIALALSFGLWLSRPLMSIEAAIARLGRHQLDQQIEIRGPADLRRVGHQLDWLRRRLVALEDDKARFLRHISHELKSPLAALCEGVALLEDETAGDLSDNQREVAAILRDNTDALQEQIEGLLQYNAAAFDARRLERRHLDLRALIETAVARQRLQWQARRLVVKVDGGPLEAHVDADKLLVVFCNLLSNAIRFSPDGGTIVFALQSLPDGVRIDCSDAGPGVAPPDVGHIFEPFRQGSRQPAGPRHGSGLGLSIVRELVLAHGGSVSLLAAPSGAHFRVELPNAY
jgi:two-component system sensor histidine kinase GlrK